jgi:hypothetical protein
MSLLRISLGQWNPCPSLRFKCDDVYGSFCEHFLEMVNRSSIIQIDIKYHHSGIVYRNAQIAEHLLAEAGFVFHFGRCRGYLAVAIPVFP